MLLSAVSVLVVAQSSSEIVEELMNNSVYQIALRHKHLYRHNGRVSALVIKCSAVIWRYLIVIVIFLIYIDAANVRTRVGRNFFYGERKLFYFIPGNLKDSHTIYFVASYIKLRKYINL